MLGKVLGALAAALLLTLACSGEQFTSGGGGSGGAGAQGGTGNTGAVDGGGGGPNCPTGSKSCAGQCVSADDPAFGCGAASCAPCALNNASAKCESGTCAIDSCNPGFGDCKPGVPGCETTLANASNCGACGKTCAAGEVCDQGNCSGSCSGSTTKCGSACVNLDDDPSHCGACNAACPQGANATPTCVNKNCVLSCNPPFDDCDNNTANGCETNLQTTAAHCSACGKACPSAPAGGIAQICSKGGCVCDSGRIACPFNTKMGCVDAKSDPAHCGSCAACPAGDYCDVGNCDTPKCAYGLTDCNGSCVNLKSDPKNCGSCGKSCTAGEACLDGQCKLATSCLGSISCGGVCTDTTTDAQHCGDSCLTCAPGEACHNGTCAKLNYANEKWSCAGLGKKDCPVPSSWPQKPALYVCVNLSAVCP